MADDLILQQRRAANRVQQMQDHARQVFEAHQGHPPTPLGPDPMTEVLRSPGLYGHPPTPVPDKPIPHHPHRPVGKPAPSLRLEEDQWLLFLLALLLFRCGCRTELLLALVYLAL